MAPREGIEMDGCAAGLVEPMASWNRDADYSISVLVLDRHLVHVEESTYAIFWVLPPSPDPRMPSKVANLA